MYRVHRIDEGWLQIDHYPTRDVLPAPFLEKNMLTASSPPPIVSSLGTARTISTTVGTKLTITHQGACLPAPIIHPRGATGNVDDVVLRPRSSPPKRPPKGERGGGGWGNPALAKRRGRPGGGAIFITGGRVPTRSTPSQMNHALLNCDGGRGGANRNVRSCDSHKPNKVRH